MAAPRFVHLRLHSEYSVSDGVVRIDDAVERARTDGMPALALTDAANVFGMVKFYRAARAGGVKPIIGVDAWLQNDTDRDKPYRILLLCASRAGYQRLCDLLSRAWLRNQHRGRAELSREWLDLVQERFQKNAEGVTRLAQCRTLPDLAAAQSDLVRDNLQQLIDVTRRVAERSMQVADEAGKAIAAETKQAAERFRRAA